MQPSLNVIDVVVDVDVAQRASGVGGRDGYDPTSPGQGRLEAGAGEIGHQDGRKGSADHKAPQALEDGMWQ